MKPRPKNHDISGLGKNLRKFSAALTLNYVVCGFFFNEIVCQCLHHRLGVFSSSSSFSPLLSLLLQLLLLNISNEENILKPWFSLSNTFLKTLLG